MSRKCAKCGKSLAGKRADAVYCTKKCKNTAVYSRKYAAGHKSTNMTLREKRIAELGYEFQGDCEICGVAVAIPHVDHDHITGKARGYLCQNCNLGLGQFKDSRARLLNAIAYLNTH